MLAQRHRATQAASFHHLGITADIHRAVLDIDNRSLYHGTGGYVDARTSVGILGVAYKRI